LVDHLTRKTPIPTKYTIPDSNTTETGNTTPQLTREFIAWKKSDLLLRVGSLEPSLKKHLDLSLA
jgi:hypothetical protein